MTRICSILSAVSIAMTPVATEGMTDRVVVDALQNTYTFATASETFLQNVVPFTTEDDVLVLDVLPNSDEDITTSLEQQEMKEAQEKAEAAAAAALAAQQAAEEAARALAQEKARAAEQNREYLGVYKLTAYCPCKQCCGKNPGDKGYGVTASGAKAQEGVTIAMAGVSFGTKVYIEGVGERVVQDRGGAIKGNRVDVFASTHERCFNSAYNTKAKVWIIK